MFFENNNNEAETSHITLKDLTKKAQEYKLKFFNSRNYKNKNKPSSKIFNFSKTMSEKIMDRFKQKLEPVGNNGNQDARTRTQKFIKLKIIMWKRLLHNWKTHRTIVNVW